MNTQKLTIIKGKYQWCGGDFHKAYDKYQKQTQSRKFRIRDRWNNNASSEIFETEDTALRNKEDQN